MSVGVQIKNEDTYYYDIVRKNIKKYRREKGYTLQRLAKKANSFSTYLNLFHKNVIFLVFLSFFNTFIN